MTREAKIGLLMVAVLVGVFGFLVYKRVTRPIDQNPDVDQQVTDVRDATTDSNNTEPYEDEPLPVPIPEKSHGRRVIENVVHKFEEVVEEVTEAVLPDSARGIRPPLPTNIASDRDDFAQPQRLPEARDQNSVTELPEPANDPFENVPDQLPAPRNIVASDDDTEADTFPDESKSAKRPQMDFGRPAKRHVISESPPDDSDSGWDNRSESRSDNRSDFRSENKSDSRSDFRNLPSEQASTETDVPEEEPAYSRQPANQPEIAPREKRRAAAISVPDDDSSFNAPSRNSVSANGDQYTIQPNDNFWSISKKRYGAGRYFTALAMHNRQTIPDPKRMKPGIVIATPDVSVLEQLYGDTISKSRPDESADSVITSQSRKSSNSGPSGFFVGENGDPMYRVGQDDTLTEIAKTHLKRSSRWVQIREMNRNVLRNGNELKVGTVLRLPADAGQIRVGETTGNLR